jgi:hypothetical protein
MNYPGQEASVHRREPGEDQAHPGEGRPRQPLAQDEGAEQ